MQENIINYTVKEKIIETHNVVTLKLICDGGIPTYRAGQFITVFFGDTGNAEGKAYTISSEPSEDTINITVKAVGEFSNRLTALEVGDTVVASLPYGYFYSENAMTVIVMIAGGVGVTPFRSMIVESLKKFPTRSLFLFCSNKTVDDIIFRNEFEMLQSSFSSLKVINYITQEENIMVGMEKGRIIIGDVLERVKEINNPEFFICGSISFVRDFWKELKEEGIPEERIYTEAFF